MNTQILIDTASRLVADHKGLLAMDESDPTCNKRFAKLGIPQTADARRAYRELIVTAPGLGESISGAILFDETIRQQKKDGTPFAKASLRRNYSRHQSGRRRERHGRASRRKNHRRPRRIARTPRGIFSDGRAFRQVARGDHHRRKHSQPQLPRGQRADARALRRVVPGSRTRSHRRAGSADGRYAYFGAMPQSHRRNSAECFHPA
jgi:hypothetical protein